MATEHNISRRGILKAGPAAMAIAAPSGIFAGLFAGGAAAAPAPLTIQEQIAHHRDELFRLLAKTVPEGTELNIATVMGGKRMDHIFMTAKRPEWGGDHFYICDEWGGPWIERHPEGSAA